MATPFARAFSSELLVLAQWRSITLFELGLALLCLGVVGIVRLPNSAPEKAIQPIDIVTFVLFATGAGLLCAVLGLGRLDWWTDSPWLGWALAGSLPLIAAALFIERGRATPLLDLQFLTTPVYLRFAAILVLGRIVFSEQGTVAIAMLGTLGVNNDESVTFGLVLTAAALAGAVSSAFLFKPNRAGWMVVAALLMVALSAVLDSHATNLTRPRQLYLTQAMFSFGSTFFVGPALMFGIGPVLANGGRPLVSFVLLFAFTQNVGSLLGASLLGTLQVIFEKANSAIIAERITEYDPQVATRLNTSAQSLATTIGDPAYRQAEAIVTLQGQVTTEANVLAYNQVFTVVAVLAAMTAIALLSVLLWTARQAQVAKRRTEQGASA